MSSLIIHHHAGLGDHFICNGVVNYLAENLHHSYCYVLCKERNFPTVSSMYGYSDKIRVIPFSDGYESTLQNRLPIYGDYYPLGFSYLDNFLRENPEKDFSEAFYSQVNLPIEDKWKRFKIQRNTEEENRIYDELIDFDEEYIFVHDESSVGKYDFNIDSELKIVKPKTGMTNNITNFLKVVENAKEVHCLDSSFISMIDLSIERENMFAHNVKGTKFPALRNEWEIVQYEDNKAPC